MTYRHDDDALRARKDALQSDLDEARKTLDAQRELAARVARMERELREVETRLAGDRKRLPMLDKVSIASPCSASWDEMTGDDRVRFCRHCEKSVFNLSAMTRDEAEALILASGAKLCVRFYRRADGTMLTEDCPVGSRKKRRRRLAAALVGATALTAAGAALASTREPPPPRTTEVAMGAVAATVTEPAPTRPDPTRAAPLQGEPAPMWVGQMAAPAHHPPATPTEGPSRAPRARRAR